VDISRSSADFFADEYFLEDLIIIIKAQSKQMKIDGSNNSLFD
jgi:hypothetical protein